MELEIEFESKRRDSMKIKELLTLKNRSVITIGADETVFAAIQKLNEFDRGALPVIDNRGELIGIVTERDVVRKCFSSDGKFINSKIMDVMTKEVAIGFPDDSLDYVVSVMRQKRIRHVPIVEDHHKIIGVVSMRDLLEVQLSEVEAEVRYAGLIPRKTPRPVL
jgi:CBS domain-containing protein